MGKRDLLFQLVIMAKDAGDVLLQFQKNVSKIQKDRKDFLTDADLKSNSLIIERLNSIDPQIPIYSEEKEGALLRKGKTWIIDPLDGTVNYFHQDNLWGVSIALAENGKSLLGVVYLPALRQVFAATEDGRFIAEGQNYGVSGEVRLFEAQIWTDWGKDSEEVFELLPKIKKISLYPQIRLCATASLMAVATGKIEAYIHPHPAPEDFAAAALIVERAGGKVTDLQGRPWNIFSASILASNGILHDQILNGIREV